MYITSESDSSQEKLQEEESEYVTEEMMDILDTIPLTMTIIKVTDILKKKSNNNYYDYNVNVGDLKTYITNIENFRLLLIENGVNEYEFCQKFAVEIIHSGIIKYRKYKNNEIEYTENKIKLIYDIFISIIGRKFGIKFLKECFNKNVNKFIELIIFIIKYPPILNQINISNRYKKKHKKNYKQIIVNQSIFYKTPNRGTTINDENDTFETLIKSYYNLYSNKTLIRNLKKFQKYIKRNKNRTNINTDSDESDSEYTTDTETESDPGRQEGPHDNTDDDDDYDKDKEIPPLIQFFNEMYEKPAKLFVKCLD